MTTILIKKKDTAGAPAAGDLTNAAGGAEIAVNTATKRIYTKDSGGNVVEVGTFPSAMAVQGNLSATGNVTLGDAAADNVTVTGTITSNLIFTDATYDIGASGANRPRDLFLSRNLTVGGTLTLAGGVNLNGNVTVGDSSSDTLTINSTITSNLIFTDNTYDIGASGATRPRNLYLAGGITAGADVAITGDYSSLSGRLSLYRTGGSSYIDFASGQSLIFRTETSSGGAGATNLMTLNSSALTLSSGNLLVKTSTARANITTDADLVSQNGLGILATSTTYGQGSQYIRFFNSGAAYTGSVSQIGGTSIGLYSAGDLALGANSATVVTVAPTSVNFFGNSGNSTWGVNYKALDVNGSFVTANGGNTIIIGTGAYLDVSGNWIRTTTSASSAYSQSVGGHQWNYAGASTIGSTVTYTALAYLNTTGYGIGTSPSYKLDVLGDSGSISTARVWNGSSGGSDGAQLLLGNSANYTNAYFRLNGGGNSSQLGVGSLNIGLVENAPLGLFTNNALRMFVAGNGKVTIGSSTSTNGKLLVYDGGALNQNSLTINSDNSASAGDWAALQLAYAGSWSTNLNSAALVSVTDNINTGLTNSVVGQFGIGFDGGGYFVVKRLYNGSYGGSGTVFTVGLTDATFSGNVTQNGTVSNQAGVTTKSQSFNIDSFTNTRVRVDTANYSFSKFRIYGQRTNGGSCVVYWEGMINNNFNTVYTTAFSSRLSDGTISLTVTVSGGSVNFDFNNAGSGAYGFVVLETTTGNTYVLTTY